MLLRSCRMMSVAIFSGLLAIRAGAATGDQPVGAGGGKAGPGQSEEAPSLPAIVVNITKDGEFYIGGTKHSEKKVFETLVREAGRSRDAKGISLRELLIRTAPGTRFGPVRRLVGMCMYQNVAIERVSYVIARGSEEPPFGVEKSEHVIKWYLPREMPHKEQPNGEPVLPGVYIIQIKSGSGPGEAAGMRPLITVDDVAVRDMEDLRATLKRLAAPAGAVELEYTLLEVDDDALQEWVLDVYGTLEELKWKNVMFKRRTY